MPDPFLYDLMHGMASVIKSKPKNSSDPFDEAFEDAIKAEVEAIHSEQQDNALISKEAALKKIEAEVRDTANLTEFGEHIHRAVEILHEGERYLEKEEFKQMNLSLDEISRKLKLLNLKNLTDESLINALAVPEPSALNILKIAIDKFSEGLFGDSLSVFSFLTLVCPDEPEYWYRMGLVAHKDGQNELALKAFQAASSLDNDFIEPRIFSTECHLALRDYDEASQELNEAKRCIEAGGANPTWAESISLLEDLIENQEAL